MKNFNISIDGKTRQLTPENCGVALFRNKPDYDYLDYWEERADEQQEHWFSFNAFVARWIGGIALTPSTQRELRLAERTHGTFRSQTGWNPDVIIEDEPREMEVELYIKHLIGHALDDDKHLHQDLAAALRPDLEE